MREFYNKEGITEKKTIVFSDSLNVERCIQYKEAADKAGFNPTFGVGTFLTSKAPTFRIQTFAKLEQTILCEHRMAACLRR